MSKNLRKPRRRGRPPKGEFIDKKATLTTRITNAVRAGLEREARRNGRSISQEVEFRLAESLKARKSRLNDRNRALAFLVGKLAEDIESVTNKSWLDDPYTCEAIEAGLKILIGNYAPRGEPKIPDWIAADIAKKPEIYDQFKTPDGLGWAHAHGLISQVAMLTEEPPVDHPKNQHYADGFYQFPKVRRAFGLDKEPKK